jgi:hypothetical protein
VVPVRFEIEAEALRQVMFVFDNQDARHQTHSVRGTKGTKGTKVIF